MLYILPGTGYMSPTWQHGLDLSDEEYIFPEYLDHDIRIDDLSYLCAVEKRARAQQGLGQPQEERTIQTGKHPESTHLC